MIRLLGRYCTSILGEMTQDSVLKRTGRLDIAPYKYSHIGFVDFIPRDGYHHLGKVLFGGMEIISIGNCLLVEFLCGDDHAMIHESHIAITAIRRKVFI